MSDIEKQNLVEGPDTIKKDPQIEKKTLCEKSRTIHPCICLFLLLIIFVPWIFVFLVIEDSEYLGTSGSLQYRDRCNVGYGCCEIFHDCVDKEKYLESGYFVKLSLDRIIPKDPLKSNCPSLETLVTNYNKAYFPNNHTCGDFGCCDSIDVTCDNAMRNIIRNGNNNETVKLFRENSKILPIFNLKIDPAGSNCGSSRIFGDIINSYNHNYPPKSDNITTLSLLLICIFCLCVSFIICLF